MKLTFASLLCFVLVNSGLIPVDFAHSLRPGLVPLTRGSPWGSSLPSFWCCNLLAAYSPAFLLDLRAQQPDAFPFSLLSVCLSLPVSCLGCSWAQFLFLFWPWPFLSLLLLIRPSQKPCLSSPQLLFLPLLSPPDSSAFCSLLCAVFKYTEPSELQWVSSLQRAVPLEKITTKQRITEQ